MNGFNFPQGGQNYGQAFQPQNYGQYQPNNLNLDERIWVQNATAAESYLLAPNGFVRLWDSSASRFYEKRADATGRPLPMEVYEYKRISPQISNIANEPNKLTYEEINAKFEDITGRIEALEKKRGAVKNAKQSDTDDTSV